MPNEPSISDLLAKAGYRHERTQKGHGKHRIIDADGSVVGFMYADEAVQFLESLSKSKK